MKIDLDQIEQNENSRVIFKVMDLAELMGSMKTHGLLQPIGVRKLPNGKYDAVFGNRRIAAAKKLGWAEIECHIVDAESDTDRDVLNLIENIKRVNTTLAEDGRMFLILKDRGLSETEIAARLQVGVNRIRVALEVSAHVPKEFQNNMPNSVRTGNKVGAISPSVTHELLQMRRRHRMSRPNFRALLVEAKKGMGLNQLREVGPILSHGGTLAQAIKAAESTKYISLEFYLSRADINRIEKKTQGTINQYLMGVLEKHSGIDSLKSKFKKNRADSMRDDLVVRRALKVK